MVEKSTSMKNLESLSINYSINDTIYIVYINLLVIMNFNVVISLYIWYKSNHLDMYKNNCQPQWLINNIMEAIS